MPRPQPPGIQDYAVVGDGRSVALVSRGGSIDWLCWPRPDSPSIFAAVLDPDRGGSFRVAPRGAVEIRRRYLDDTNVLATTFRTPTGRARLVDLMPVSSEADKRRRLVPAHELLRIVVCEAGEVELEVLFAPRPDYARREARLRDAGPLGIRLEVGARLYTLRADVPVALDSADTAVGRVRLRAGQRARVSLSYDEDGPAVLPPLGEAADASVERTARWWSAWAGRCAYDGPYRDEVVRSLLAVKLLSFAPSGAIIAAPTTSLPERPGGELNWDYRFCWLRDAALTVRALCDLGYGEDASAFVDWLLHATRLTRPALRVLYDVHGEQPRAEEELDHLAGFAGSRPVRIHNAAAGQLQLDVYGEVVDAVAQRVRRGAGLDRDAQAFLRAIGDYVCAHGREADDGIWEPRSGRRHRTFSRVLGWVALDRLLELDARGALRGLDATRVRAARDLLRRDVEERGWNPALGAYAATLGGDDLDASLLLMSWYGYADAREPRLRRTFERIDARLSAGRGLLYRYDESRAAGEGAFGICGFWAAEYLARGGGTLDAAEERFEQLLAHGNDVGLFAEQVDPATGAPLGNFPQAFTHVGLVGAALAIEERRATDANARRGSTSAEVPEARP